MPDIIIKQKDGLYCVWSTVVDDIIMYNCTADDILDRFEEKAKKQAKRDFDWWMHRSETTAHRYRQEALRRVSKIIKMTGNEPVPQLPKLNELPTGSYFRFSGKTFIKAGGQVVDLSTGEISILPDVEVEPVYRYSYEQPEQAQGRVEREETPMAPWAEQAERWRTRG